MPLIFAASGSIALSKASGPSRMPPVIWPRSAILHSAAASMVEGIFDVTVSTADRIATRGVPRPTCGEEVDGVLDDVALGVEIGKDVDRRVGDEQRLGIGRHVHDEDVADPPRRAQAGRRRTSTCAHQLVGVQAALHQQLALGLADRARRPLPRPPRCARHVDDLEAADIEAVLARHRRDLRGRPDQDRNDDAGFGRFDRRRAAKSRRRGARRSSSPAGTSFARAISRSYLVRGGAANGPIAAMTPISLSLSAAMITSPCMRSSGCAEAAYQDAFAWRSFRTWRKGVAGRRNAALIDAEQPGDLRPAVALSSADKGAARSQHLPDQIERLRAASRHRAEASTGWLRAPPPGRSAA